MANPERIEKLENKVKELEKQNQRLKGLLDTVIDDEIDLEDENQATPKQQFSRRSFMKKIGAGALGLGAVGLVPAASKLKLTDSGITQNGNSFWNSGISNLTPDNIDWSSTDTTGLDADSVDGYEIQKNGTDGSGVINFKT